MCIRDSYITVQIQQVNYATPLNHSIGSFVALITFVSGFYIAKLLVEKRQSLNSLHEVKKEIVEKGCN